jgi:hypothetical protein
MSQLGQKRRFNRRPVTSGLTPGADILRGVPNVSNVPRAGIFARQRTHRNGACRTGRFELICVCGEKQTPHQTAFPVQALRIARRVEEIAHG